MRCVYFFSRIVCKVPICCCCSVTKSYPALWDPMDWSTPGFPVHYQLLELAQTRVDQVGDAIQPPYSVVPFYSCLQPFPASGSFPLSQFFASGGQSIGVSASASVLPMNIQDWFPLGWTGLIWEYLCQCSVNYKTPLISYGLYLFFSQVFKVHWSFSMSCLTTLPIFFLSF